MVTSRICLIARFTGNTKKHTFDEQKINRRRDFHFSCRSTLNIRCLIAAIPSPTTKIKTISSRPLFAKDMLLFQVTSTHMNNISVENKDNMAYTTRRIRFADDEDQIAHKPKRGQVCEYYCNNFVYVNLKNLLTPSIQTSTGLYPESRWIYPEIREGHISASSLTVRTNFYAFATRRVWNS